MSKSNSCLLLLIALLMIPTTNSAEYRPNGTLVQGGQVVHNPAMDQHIFPHQDQHTYSNMLLMSYSATAVSNSVDPAFIQNPLSVIEGAMNNATTGRSAAILYLDQNPYVVDPNYTTYNQILTDATGTGYRTIIAADGNDYLAKASSRSSRGLVRSILRRIPNSGVFHAAKDPGGGGVIAMVRQSQEAVLHLRKVAGSNMFLHIAAGNKRGGVDTFLGTVALNSYKQKTTTPVFMPGNASANTWLANASLSNISFDALHKASHNKVVGATPWLSPLIPSNGFTSKFIRSGSSPGTTVVARRFALQPQTTPGTTQPQTVPPTSESALLASLLGPAQAGSAKEHRAKMAISRIRKASSLVKTYVKQGRELNARAMAIIRSQVSISALQLKGSKYKNLCGQGLLIGDPVLVATGFESYSARDFSYTSLKDSIHISRHFRSNQTDLLSAFGRSWFFNYDSRIIVGRKPLIRQRERATAELLEKAAGLDKRAEKETTKAHEALGIIRGPSPATTTSKLQSTGAFFNKNRSEPVAQSETADPDTMTEMTQLVNTIDNDKNELSAIVDNRIADAKEAADEARAEERRYPANPYPEDPSYYFGEGFVKLIDANGLPILFQQQQDGRYLPVTDNGSYTDIIFAVKNGFQLRDKNGGIREFGHSSGGVNLLVKTIDTNGNTTRFVRKDALLTKIIDPVGRNTTFTYTRDRLISSITDPLGRVRRYAYKSSLLTRYTDPMGYNWQYTYDNKARMTGRIDPQNNVYGYEYDGQDRIVRETDKEGHIISYNYDPAKRMTRMTDRLGRVTSYYYNVNNRVEKKIFPDGSEVAYGYDNRNNVTHYTDELGQITIFVYNDVNEIIRVVNSLGETQTAEYEPGFNKISRLTDQLGRSRYFNYDSHGNLIKVKHPDGSTVNIAYNKRGLPEIIVDENKRKTELSYDALGQLATVHHPDGSRQELTADVLGHITSVTDELGNSSSFTYNALDKMVQSIDPRGGVTSFSYDERQHKIGTTNALGHTVRYEYSPNGNLIRKIDAMGEAITSVYDAEENRIRKTYPNKTGVQYSYDGRNHEIAKITFPGKLITTSEYDRAGRRIATTDANGHRKSYSYDALGRITAVTDPTGSITRREYDGAGNLIKVLDGNSNPISYEYDLRNRMISQTNALGNSTFYEYDPVGNLTATTSPVGAQIEYSRDLRNRLTKVLYPGGDHKEFDYDLAGRMIRMTHGDSLEVRHYDSRGQLVMTDNTKGGVIQYSYDLLGNRISMTNPDGSTTRYTYNPRNKLIRQQDGTGVSRFDYDNMGRELTATLPDNSITRRQYNNENRLESLITSNKTGAILTSFLYSYDNIGNKLSMTEEDGAVTRYSYDTANRLTGVVYPKRDMLPEVVNYTYDPAGNRIKTVEDDHIITSRYNEANQLLQSGNTHYSYDDNGNRIGKTTEKGTSFYQYTADNFLSAFISATGLKTTYGYDALNRRTLKDSKDKTETFLYDGIKILQEQTTGPKPQVALYSRAKGRLLAKQMYPDQPGSQTTPESLFYHHDALGSIIGLTDSNSKLITRYRYDAFGKLLAGDTSKNQYTFTGKRLDPESGLYHFHFRQYDAEVGVWTTPDPIGILGGVNLYQYALNNPVNKVDWLGLHLGSSEGPGDHGDIGGSESDSNNSTEGHSHDDAGDGTTNDTDYDTDVNTSTVDNGGFGKPNSTVGHRDDWSGEDVEDGGFWGTVKCMATLLGKISSKVGQLSYKTVDGLVQGYFGNPMPGVLALDEWETLIPEVQEMGQETESCLGQGRK